MNGYQIDTANLAELSRIGNSNQRIGDIQSALIIKKIESGTLEFSHDQEYNFKKYQKLYSNGKGYANELDYWKSNKMFEVESLSQLAKTYSGGVIL